ncbi:DUF6265 family protein [Mucilaginibacter litoreus]|uniref:DUF6265 family protein n=1 Tax=Mucilaginibacter litoreus TaxID=1048221 RepID=A0ABW3ATB2_9SPHI
MKKLSLIVIILINTAISAFAQKGKASISDLNFMTGTWTLKHKWGDMEEIWSKPMGDNLMSTFRCVKDGKVVFYEFMVVEQAASGPVLILRHFNKGSIGWEDKDKPYLMPAVAVTKNQVAYLSKDKKVLITYKRLSTQRLDCILDEEGKDGKWTQEVFSYTLNN